MSIILIDGFDLYNGTGANTGAAAKWTFVGSGSSSMQTGRFGGQALRNSSTGGASRQSSRGLPSTYSSFSCGFAVNFSTLDARSGFLVFESAGTTMCGLSLNASAGIDTGRHTSVTSKTVLTSSANSLIVASTWYYIEVEVVISDTVGRMTVWLDGVNIINPAANQDTRNGAPTTIDTIRFNLPTATGSADFDDLYMTDSASRLGERKVETIYPTSDVAQGFARSTGATNYTLVDEATVNGDTDYVQGSSVGDVDTYGLGNLSNSPTTIDAVQVSAFAEKTDAGSRSIALQVISGGTTSTGSDYALGATYGKFERILETDPNTSAAWTASGVNALTGGPKVTV